VQQIWAETDTSRIPVPFAPAPFSVGGGSASRRVAPGPTKVDRKVSGGTIGWLNRHEPRGEPLVLPGRHRNFSVRNAVFGRVIAPDPSRPLRVVVTLNHSRHGHRPKGLCTYVITRNAGAGGGCAVRATVFALGPITGGIEMMRSGSDEFVTVSGLASDDVARIVAFLADGQRMPVSLADNVYAVDIARSRLPARLVAYDRQQRVIGFTPPVTGPDVGGPSPARGRARLLLHGVSPTGSTAALFVGRSTNGGRCMYLRFDRGTMVSCGGRTRRGSPLQLTGREFVAGRVRPDVATVLLRFADGTQVTVVPTEGFVLYTVPRRHLARGHHLVAAVAHNAAGAAIATQSFSPPPRR
jgi:hypothetical protein